MYRKMIGIEDGINYPFSRISFNTNLLKSFRVSNLKLEYLSTIYINLEDIICITLFFPDECFVRLLIELFKDGMCIAIQNKYRNILYTEKDHKNYFLTIFLV